jgi:peptidoglycan/xylan/chitin deacetylase (PgdA/CDA1 family)
MRFLVIVVAALMSLGLAAFGVVSAQRASAPSAASANAPGEAAATSRLASLTQKVLPVRAPVSQIAQSASETPAAVSSGPVTPMRLAQATTAQNPAPAAAATPPAPSAPAANKPAIAAAPPPNNIPACDKPGGMGLSRVVEIDTTGGPGFGFEHFKQYDFLHEKEVVLTFDDGPWPENTMAVVRALTENCLKGTFFEIGEHAMWHPEITKQVIESGQTVGTHTWSHKDLARNPYASDLEKAKQEIEMGNSAVHMAAAGANGPPVAAFFRFPDLQHPAPMVSYLGERNIAIFSTDVDSFDFKLKKPDLVIKSIMTKLEKRGKGIILMHDFQRGTAEAMPELLRQLKAGGYKVVHMVAAQPLTTLPKYDEMVTQKDKLSSNNTRPENSVVRTIGQ